MTRFLRAVALALLVVQGPVALAQVPGQAVRHTLAVSLTPASGEIRIDDSLQVEARARYRFRLAPWLFVDSLTIDGTPASFRREGYDYVVSLPGPGRHRLEFVLRGVVPARGNAGQAATDMVSSSGSDGVFLPGYDAWIPRDPGESITYRIQVRVPVAQRAVATGRFVSEQSGEKFYQAVFEASRPTAAPSLFAGPYRVRERRSGGLRLRTYFHADLDRLSEVYLDAAAGYIQRYDQSIGAYPYTDFHIVSAPLPVGLGFPNLTYIGRTVIPLPFMRGRSLAHEVLHNWWGNGVAVDYAGGNWAEGLTTYMADYALQRDRGAAAARSMRVKWLRDYAALPAERDRPVRAFISKGHQASQVIGYNKVAFIFHMLALEIGQSAFDAGLRRFWERHQYKTAGWLDLQRAFEQSSGRELGWFFLQWLDRRGAPRLNLGGHRLERVENGYRLSVEILQPISGYRLKLPVSLQTTNGIERHEINVSETLTRVEWTTSAKPQAIHFDPDSDVFRLLQAGEAPPILRDITLSANAASVIESEDSGFVSAARGLAARLMDVEPRFEQLQSTGAIDRPLMLVTPTDKLAGRLAQLELQRPVELDESSWTAAVWTARRSNGSPVLIVVADDADALRALLRPLPHYAGQSYVLFESGRAVSKGIWPIRRGPLSLEFTDG